MKRVPQRTQTDCGVACVAMLAGVPYEEARAAFKFRHRNQITSTKDCIKALRRLGVLVADRLRPLGPDPVETLTCRALLKTNKRRTCWHWTVYDPASRSIIDPSASHEHRVTAYLPLMEQAP